MSDAYIIKRGGSGGGDGNYAVINITYDAGEQVTVTHNGEIYEAPDTSGIWLFGCEENGSYVCSLVNETHPISETITITEKGQIKEVKLQIQVAINYKLLYYLGNEYTEETGGWVSPGTYTAQFGTTNTIDYGDKPYKFQFGKGTLSTKLIVAHANKGGQIGIRLNIYELVTYIDKTPSGTSNYSENFRGVDSNATTAKNQKLVVSGESWYNLDKEASYVATKNAKNMQLKVNVNITGYSSTSYGNSYYYAVGFAKKDDISGLSKYGTTESAIISKASSLFNDKNSLIWMVRNCTGTFMINALSNSNFVTVMNSSANKTILLGNEHWAKFIALLSV